MPTATLRPVEGLGVCFPRTMFLSNSDALRVNLVGPGRWWQSERGRAVARWRSEGREHLKEEEEEGGKGNWKGEGVREKKKREHLGGHNRFGSP